MIQLRKVMCVVALFVAIGAQGQNLKIHVDEKGRVGFADSQGNVVVECKYETAFPFSNGFAIVGKSDKYGIINATGEVVLPLKYEKITPWNDLYLIKSGKNLGLASKNGEIVLKPEYSMITPINCYGKALVGKGGKATPIDKKTVMRGAKYGIIDRNGTVLIPAEHKGLFEFSLNAQDTPPFGEGIAAACVNHFISDTLETDCSYLVFSKNDTWPIGGNKAFASNCGLMDGTGKEIIKEKIYYYLMKPQNNMVRTYNFKFSKKEKETIGGYYDLTNDKYIQVNSFTTPTDQHIIWTHGDFAGGMAPVSSSTTWSFVDKTGKVLRDGYKEIGHHPLSHLWIAKNSSNTLDVFDEDNNDIPVLSGYSEFNSPRQEGDKEIFNVKKGDKWGAITRSGQEVIPFEYETVWPNYYDFVMVKKDGKFGALTPNNEQLIPVEYSGVCLPTERNAKNIWVQKSDSLFYNYNVERAQETTKGYKYVNNFKDGITLVVPKGFTPKDDLLNKALFYAPNTASETILQLQPSKQIGYYGILINVNDEVLFSEPITSLYSDKAFDAIKAKGGIPLTKMEMKNLLLDVTKENRSYQLSETLGEDEWNY